MGPESNEAVRLRLDYGHVGDGTLYLRISPWARDEMLELLKAHHVYRGEIMEFSAVQDLAVLAATGGPGLAAVLVAFFHRNRHKKVTFRSGDTTTEVVGFGEAESRRITADAIAEMMKRQAERDAEYRRMVERSRPDEQDPPPAAAPAAE